MQHQKYIPPLFNETFIDDNDIIETIHDLYVPCDDLHLIYSFLLNGTFLLEIYVVEFKEFIPSINVNWFQHLIHKFDAFE